MGSLVPGWDADVVIPRDLAPDSDIDKPSQPEGYFARLRSHRHSSGGPAEDAAASPLSRISAPQSLTRSATTKQGPIQRARTSAHSGPHGPQGSSHTYQCTDWSEELTSLRQRGLGRRSVGATPGDHDRDQEGGSAWWRALEVGHLNEHPDAEQNFVHDTQRSTFVPQFTPSTKLDFGGGESGASGVGQ